MLVLPEEPLALPELETLTKFTLDKMGYQHELHEVTPSGVNYVTAYAVNTNGSSEKRIAPFLNLDYGLHSLTTHLSSGTSLDLILGREDLREVAAKDRIAEERKYKNAFCVLS